MASLELAVIITVPLAVILVIIVLSAIYCVCYWSYSRTRMAANNQTCRMMCVTNNQICCRNDGEERSDIEGNEMFTDHVTPEAIVPQGRSVMACVVVVSCDAQVKPYQILCHQSPGESPQGSLFWYKGP